MPTLFSTTLKHSLENLSAQCPQHLAPQKSNSITLVCLFLRIHLDSCLPLIVLLEILSFLWSRLPTRTSVMRIQVGLQLMGRMDNRDLVQVKQLVDTFAGPHHRTPTDAAAHAAEAHQVLTDAIVALLRYSGCYVASDCSLFTHTSAEQVEERFTYYSLEERGMWSDDIWEDGSRVSPESASGASQRDYSNWQVSHLVVTLLVVANLKGNWGFSPIKDAGDVVENLKKLGCIPAGAIQKIGVYCTSCSGQFKMAIKYPKFKYY